MESGYFCSMCQLVFHALAQDAIKRGDGRAMEREGVVQFSNGSYGCMACVRNQAVKIARRVRDIDPGYDWERKASAIFTPAQLAEFSHEALAHVKKIKTGKIDCGIRQNVWLAQTTIKEITGVMSRFKLSPAMMVAVKV